MSAHDLLPVAFQCGVLVISRKVRKRLQVTDKAASVVKQKRNAVLAVARGMQDPAGYADPPQEVSALSTADHCRFSRVDGREGQPIPPEDMIREMDVLRLDIDEPTQREYFMDAFDPPDGNLPFVGVTDPERSVQRPCLTGRQSAAAYRRLLLEAAGK